ncbi:MAG: hypothetical protein QOF53_2631 [Nocardioidaceae bacterium]|nr:hypothetical protein [Nocardioidaceae bacterium]
MNKSMQWPVALGSGLVLSLGLLAPVARAAPAAAVASGSTGVAAISTVAANTATTAKVALPTGWRTRQAAVAAKLHLDVTPAREAVDRALNPDDYTCGPTDLDAYVDRLLSGMDAGTLDFLSNSGVLDFPTYDALLFGSDTDARYALTPDYRQQLSKTFRDVKRFWDISSSDIQLHAMHGSVLEDPVRLTRLLTVLYGLPKARATTYAKEVVAKVAATPAFRGGDNPIFTLNAFAFSADGEGGIFAGVPDKLIFGDGILDALAAMGISDVGPRAVMGHEFGHHVQYEDNLFDSPLTGAEATRRTELMADAFGTYFATHSRGLALNAKRVLQTEKTFYEVGDCVFDSPGHHGTPLQRERASAWGAQLANDAHKQGHILPSRTVAADFEAVLPKIVAPDAG